MTDPDRVAAWAAHYEANPPWDIGRPQKGIVGLAEQGFVKGAVLEVGCGTGEHALALAARGFLVLGVDFVPAAIDRARAKAAERGIDARFVVGDALELGALGEQFDTIIDVGVFHVFDDGDRARYVASLAQALRAGGLYAMLVFSDREPKDWGGPRRIAKSEIEAAFTEGWRIRAIDACVLETSHADITGHGWLAVIERT
jgi:SAM-dependent methyltransferase